MDLQHIKERTNRIAFTPELINTYSIDRSVIEEKAKTLEDSVNGVVFVTDESRGGVRVDVIRSRSAKEDIIQRVLEDMYSEVIRSSDDGNELWG